MVCEYYKKGLCMLNCPDSILTCEAGGDLDLCEYDTDLIIRKSTIYDYKPKRDDVELSLDKYYTNLEDLKTQKDDAGGEMIFTQTDLYCVLQEMTYGPALSCSNCPYELTENTSCWERMLGVEAYE